MGTLVKVVLTCVFWFARRDKNSYALKYYYIPEEETEAKDDE